jgi:group I intron endonuclease
MDNYIVYIHVAPNNKVYVGVTSNSLSRRSGSGGNGYCTQQLFWRAIQKYGWGNFQHIVLADHLSREWAYKLEQYLILEYKANNPKYGYNQSLGGEKSPLGSHHKLSEETKCKMSESRRGEKHPFYGKHHSDATKRKIRDSMMGNKNALGSVRSEETRKKISLVAKGRVISDMTKEKLRQRALEQWKRQKGENTNAK